MVVNSPKAWFLAARPKTLAGAAAPVLIGGALAVHNLRRVMEADATVAKPAIHGGYVWVFVLCLLFAFIMQIDANFVNDYFDFKKGTDREDRLGPERACAQGWVTPEAMKRALWITTILGCAVGLPLVWIGGPWMILVGLLCVAAVMLYTTRLSYIGLGDVLVVVFFGVVPVLFTYWCMMAQACGMDFFLSQGAWGKKEMLGGWGEAILLGLAMGLVTDCLLMVNNYRDVEQDKISGKRTVVVLFGKSFGRRAYLWLGIIGALIATATMMILCKDIIVTILLLYFVLHVKTYRKMCRMEGKALNKVLGETARNIFIFGLLCSVFLYFT